MNKRISTAGELGKMLLKLGDRPLCQVITVSVPIAGITFLCSQITNFYYNDKENELFIDLGEDGMNE